MQPHLFVDSRPPHVHVAALGDLGGAIGAALLRARRGVTYGAALTQPVVHLSSVLRSPLLDRAGERLGRVEDLIVRLADGGYPPVTGLKARIGGRELFVPVDRIAVARAGRGAAVRREAEPRALRAPGGGGAAGRRRARPQARQRRGRSADARHGARDRARLHRGLVAGRRRRPEPARAAAPAAATAPARADRRSPVPRLDRPRAVRRSRAERPPALLAIASSPTCIRPRSPTSSRPPRTTRARRSSRRSARIASSRPTSSRSSTSITSSSSSASAPTRRWRRSSRAWRPTTPPT